MTTPVNLKSNEAASAWMREQQPHAIARLGDLVSLNSFTNNLAGVNRVQERLADQLSSLGLTVSRTEFKDRGDIIEATTKAFQPSGGGIVLVAHADTVHPEDSMPHTLIERDGKLYGPGAYDMKAGVITIELALKALKAADLLDRLPVKVVVNSAEEAGTLETKAFMAQCAAGARAALVFEFGRDGGGIVVSRKGMFIGEISMKGKSAHAGNNALSGVSAIEELVTLLAPLPKAVRAGGDDTSFNLGTITGGTARNVIADFAETGFEARSATIVGIERAKACLETHLSGYTGAATPSLHINRPTPPLEETARSLKLAEEYTRAAAKAGLTLKLLPRQGGLSDANWVGSAGVPVIDGLGPLGGGAHTKDEHVLPESIKDKSLALLHFLLMQPEVPA